MHVLKYRFYSGIVRLTGQEMIGLVKVVYHSSQEEGYTPRGHTGPRKRHPEWPQAEGVWGLQARAFLCFLREGMCADTG